MKPIFDFLRSALCFSLYDETSSPKKQYFPPEGLSSRGGGGNSAHIIPYLKSQDATIRGLAAWIMGMPGMEEPKSDLAHLTTDEAELHIFIDSRLVKCRTKDLVKVPMRHRSAK